MQKRRTLPEIIPCLLSEEVDRRVQDYAAALLRDAHKIGDHGLSAGEFERSGLFRSAIERIRGTMSASMSEKRQFMAKVLDFLQTHGKVAEWQSAGSNDRHDYEVRFEDGRIGAIETKGCLDGNNTNIFIRPPHADEFVIWSLCQNAAADPRHNVWSGIHTRLGAELIAKKQRIDALIIWDMLCGTAGRPCPKILADASRARSVGKLSLPPPCIYLFPKSIPDPRNNPSPDSWRLDQVTFARVLAETFGCRSDEIYSVQIEAKRENADLVRRTSITKGNQLMRQSKWTKLKRSGT